ncbi:MAG: hypothetical protein H7175_02065 [Burkholderiales bacterium]|nr:hypothetical protein [Anaerolineae bacterium]
MMSEGQRRGWELWRENKLIGVLHFRSRDRDWFICDFEPTLAFENYRHLFDKYVELIENPGDTDYAAFYDEHIRSLDLTLVSFGNISIGKEFILDIFDGNEAWLRSR